MIDPHQFFPRKEDDGLLDKLEFGLIAFDIVLFGVFVPKRPVEEPDQVLVLLFHADLLQLRFLAQVFDEGGYSIGIKEFQVVRLAEQADMPLEGMHGMQGRELPTSLPALFADKLADPLVHGQIQLGVLPLQSGPYLLPQFFRCGPFLATECVKVQEGDHFGQLLVDDFGRNMFAVFGPGKHPHVVSVVGPGIVPDGGNPLLRGDAVPHGGSITFTHNIGRYPDRAFSGPVHLCGKIELCRHSSAIFWQRSRNSNLPS